MGLYLFGLSELQITVEDRTVILQNHTISVPYAWANLRIRGAVVVTLNMYQFIILLFLTKRHKINKLSYH